MLGLDRWMCRYVQLFGPESFCFFTAQGKQRPSDALAPLLVAYVDIRKFYVFTLTAKQFSLDIGKANQRIGSESTHDNAALAHTSLQILQNQLLLVVVPVIHKMIVFLLPLPAFDIPDAFVS